MYQKARRSIFSALFIMAFSISMISCSSNAEDRQSAGDETASPEKVRVLFDTDANNEIDDQHALAYLLFNADHFDVEGVTVNSTKEPDVQLDYAEAARVLKLSKAYEEIPLFKGADSRFKDIEGNINSPNFEGAPAVNFIIKQAMAEAEKELVILAVGKLTNVALALKKEPAISSRARVVWLGSNYPEPGEHNQDADTTAMNYVLNSEIPFEMVTVRYGDPSGTDAVKVTQAQIQQRMPGAGPMINEPVTGRHGGEFKTFGDYAVNLFNNYEMGGNPPSRPLFDMAAVAILKDSSWADKKEVPAPILVDGEWQERPNNQRTMIVWENFDIYGILNDFFMSMENPVLVNQQ